MDRDEFEKLHHDFAISKGKIQKWNCRPDRLFKKWIDDNNWGEKGDRYEYLYIEKIKDEIISCFGRIISTENGSLKINGMIYSVIEILDNQFILENERYIIRLLHPFNLKK